MTLIAALLLAISTGLAVGAPDGPTVAQVLAVCERGLAAGDKGLDAAICDWYAAPCACHLDGGDAEIGRWCIPESEPTATTISKVVAELHRYPSPTEAVDEAVPKILARLYPCPAGTAD